MRVITILFLIFGCAACINDSAPQSEKNVAACGSAASRDEYRCESPLNDQKRKDNGSRINSEMDGQ